MLSSASINHNLDSFFRRALDILAGFFGLLLLSPLFLWVAVLLRRDSPGPLFYHGPRVGKDGRSFHILKFRTMYERPESYQGARLTGQGDARVTPFGAWLRNTKLNELPQLWNVLVGDMSLVGPRPEDPLIIQSWPEDMRHKLLRTRPGVTSPASVVYRDEEKMLSSASLMEDYYQHVLPAKLRLDAVYLRNRTILSDLDVIFWTLVVLLPMAKTQPIPRHLLYWGPISRIFNRYVAWLVVDSVIAFAALGLAGVIWRTAGPLDIGLARAAGIALAFACLFSISNWMLGLARVEWSRAAASEVFTLSFSTGLAFVLMYGFNRIFELRLPGALQVMAALFAVAGFTAARYRDRLITGLATRWLNLRGGVRAVGERVLVVGAGENGALAAWLFGHGYFNGTFEVVGMVDDDPRKLGMQMERYRVLGTTERIPELVDEYRVNVVFFTIDHISATERERILAVCRSTPARVVCMPDALRPLMDGLLRPAVPVQAAAPQDTPAKKNGHDVNTGWIHELNQLAEDGKWDHLRERLSEMNRLTTAQDETQS